MPDFEDFNPNNPYTAIALLGERVKNLGREKEELERALERERAERETVEADHEDRINKMEVSFNRGAGVMLVLPFIGGIVGLLFAYGKTIFKPWTSGQ